MSRLRELVLWAGAALGLLAIATGLAVAFLGFHLLVFRSGSMSPEIPTGSLALARTEPASELARGDVVSVTASTGDRITHRVVSTTLRGDTASLVLRGDANATADEELYRVTEADRVVASVPWGGYVLAHALTPPGLVAAGAAALMLLVLGFSSPSSTVSASSRGPAASGPGRHVGDRRSGRRTTTTVTAVTAVGAVVLAAGLAAGSGSGIDPVTGTWARFTDQATSRTGSFDAARYFTCDAATKGVAAPYLYWELDEAFSTGTITAADSGAGNRPGTYVNPGSTNFRQAKACSRDAGSAVRFNGATTNYATSQFVTTQSTTAVTPPNVLTVSIWFKTTTTTGGKLIGFGDSRAGSSVNNDRHLYMTNDGRVIFGVFFSNSVRTIQSAAGLNDNRWHHAAATLSSAGSRLFVDGVLVGADASTTGGQNGYTGFWRVGYDKLESWTATPTSAAFAGTLDDAAVWTSALSDADVAALARSGR